MNAVKKNGQTKRAKERRNGRIGSVRKQAKGLKKNTRLSPYVLADDPPTGSAGNHNG